MGQVHTYLSFLLPTKQSIKLCDDMIDENTDFMIQLIIRTIIPIDEKSEDLLVNYLHRTNPVITYGHHRNYYMLYRHNIKAPHLRSNVSGDIISSIAAELAIYSIQNKICDPYSIEVDIILEPHGVSLKKLLHVIVNNKYMGKMYGIDKLSEEKIKEQFSML